MRLPSPREIKIELARKSLGHYVELTSNIKLHRWQWDLCEVLERFKAERGLRLLIHGPSQFGKSIIMTKRLPAWLLGDDPDARIVVAAYNARQAKFLTEPVLATMRAPEHGEIFPQEEGRIARPFGVEAFFTELRKSRADSQHSLRAVSIEQGFTGAGADHVLIDDPYRSMKDARSPTINRTTCNFYPEGVAPRIGDDTNVGVMFHRYHDADLVANLLSTGKWEEIRFPLIADEDEGTDPTRYWRKEGEILSPLRSMEWVEEQRGDPQVFASMMQGRPLPEGGRLFDTSWFEIIDRVPRYTRWVRYWDLATSTKTAADFTAGALVGLGPENQIVIADITRWKREWPATRDGETNDQGQVVAPGIIGIAEADRHAVDRMYDLSLGENKAAYHVGVESQGMQLALIQDLNKNATFGRIPLWPETANGKGDKKQRASTWAARARNGQVKIVRGPWNQAFLDEVKVFDGLGLSHDDQVDAVSGAVELLYAKTGGEVRSEPVPEHGTYEYWKRVQAANKRPARRR